MELRVLRYFLTVAREQSISGAANRLHITQPTLSRQIMDLEAELGTKLFNRGGQNRRLTLTQDGIFLRERAEKILELSDRTEAELSIHTHAVTGDIYIGAGETEGMRIVARTVKRLQERYPQIRYHLYSGNGDDVTQRLDQGLLDFGILLEPADVSRYAHLLLPQKDTWGLLVHRDHPLAQKPYVCAADMEGLPLLASRPSAVGPLIASWLGMDTDKLHFAATHNLIYNASLLVSEGVGCAVCLDKLSYVGRDDVCFRPFSPKAETKLYFVWKKNAVFSKAAEKFLAQLREEIEQDQAQ